MSCCLSAAANVSRKWVGGLKNDIRLSTETERQSQISHLCDGGVCDLLLVGFAASVICRDNWNLPCGYGVGGACMFFYYFEISIYSIINLLSSKIVWVFLAS